MLSLPALRAKNLLRLILPPLKKRVYKRLQFFYALSSKDENGYHYHLRACPAIFWSPRRWSEAWHRSQNPDASRRPCLCHIRHGSGLPHLTLCKVLGKSSFSIKGRNTCCALRKRASSFSPSKALLPSQPLISSHHVAS